MVTHIITLYNRDAQKSISECMTHQNFRQLMTILSHIEFLPAKKRNLTLQWARVQENQTGEDWKNICLFPIFTCPLVNVGTFPSHLSGISSSRESKQGSRSILLTSYCTIYSFLKLVEPSCTSSCVYIAQQSLKFPNTLIITKTSRDRNPRIAECEVI